MLLLDSYETGSHNSSVSIVTRLRGSIPGRGQEFFSSPPRPDRLWGPHNFLSSRYRGSFPGDKAAGARS